MSKVIRGMLVVMVVIGFVSSVHAETVIYSKNNVDAKDVDTGEIIKSVATDGGAMLKVTDIQKMIDAAKKKNATEMDIKVLIDNKGALVMSVDSKAYKKKQVIIKDYEKQKSEKATVINMQKGDKVIDDSSERMAKAKNTDVKEPDDVSGKDIKGDIIILAHGGKSKLAGKVVGTKFARKTPAQIVDYITKNLKLSKKYKGVIYLDGCYTAAGPGSLYSNLSKEMGNFSQAVYNGLVKNGYQYLQVKGNLGAAITRANGDELVLDAQTEEEFKQQNKKAKLDADWIENLVGTFGPEKH